MSTTQPAGGTVDENAPKNDRSVLSDMKEQAYPNDLNQQGDGSSPYGGTQSPDPDAPDGNQNAPRKPLTDNDPTQQADLGSEYGSDSSYGTPNSGGKEGDAAKGDDAAGTPIR